VGVQPTFEYQNYLGLVPEQFTARLNGGRTTAEE
jgi:hypothetical protein